VNRKPVLFYRLAVAALLASSLTLAGCGRKGALDAPPGGLAANPNAVLDGDTEDGPAELVRRGSARGLPVIKGPKRSIPLDVLLN
jgi:predicted small lipoprotein YifL